MLKFLMNKNILSASIVFFGILYVVYTFKFDIFYKSNTILLVFMELLFFIMPLYWTFFIMVSFKKSKFILAICAVFFIFYFWLLIKMGIFHYGTEVILNYLNNAN